MTNIDPGGGGDLPTFFLISLLNFVSIPLLELIKRVEADVNGSLTDDGAVLPKYTFLLF